MPEDLFLHSYIIDSERARMTGLIPASKPQAPNYEMLEACRYARVASQVSYRYFSSNGFKSGEEGRGASIVTTLPCLSNTKKRGIAVIL